MILSERFVCATRRPNFTCLDYSARWSGNTWVELCMHTDAPRIWKFVCYLWLHQIAVV